MSLKDHMTRVTSGLSDVDTVEDKAAARGRRGTGSMPASATLLHFSEDAREMALELEALKRDKGKAIRIRIDICDDGPFHATPMDQGRVDRLAANLRENGQNTPSVVRALPDGRYQIVAGRHRRAALQQLGETEWDVVVRDYDDDLAERLTFYDNLLAPSLPDFYKYLSFSSRKSRSGKTIAELSKESGLSEPLISNLLAFGKLPTAGLEVIAAHPHLYGSHFARQAATLVSEHEEDVVEAIKKVAVGMEQTKALLSIGRERSGRAARAPTVEFKRGDAPFAVLTRTKKQVVLRFEDEHQATAIQSKIERLVRDHLKK
jgi:ParB family chromosome partitioning protein